MLSNYKADQVLFITFFFTFLHILPHDRWPKIGPATKSILCLSGLTRIWLQWQPCIVIAFSKPQLATLRCRKSFKILDKDWNISQQDLTCLTYQWKLIEYLGIFRTVGGMRSGSILTTVKFLKLVFMLLACIYITSEVRSFGKIWTEWYYKARLTRLNKR